MLQRRMGYVVVLMAFVWACGTPPVSHLTTGPKPSPSAAPTHHLEVVATDADFVPDPMWVKAGDVTFNIVNQGQIEHSFKITDQDGDPIGKTAPIPPGGSASLEVPSLAVGYYVVSDVQTSHVAAHYKVDLIAV